MQRRSFIHQTASLLGLAALHQTPAHAFAGIAAGQFSEDEAFWHEIRLAYATSPNIMNLNNGGISPSPRATLEAINHYNHMVAEAPTFYMWRILDQNREPLRYSLAQLGGVDTEEVTYNRNATESLNTIVFGLPLRAGDEVVLSKYDYPNMISAWKQRELRDGIKLVWVDLQLPSEDASYMANAFIEKFTERTKIVHLTHIINWCGQILPVRTIADAAHRVDIEVLVDGAHSFALLDYKIPDLGADYFGTSLHKWLCAPIGTGMMWIKKEKIEKIWPLLGGEKPQGDNIRKFEHLGTRSFPIEMATGYSIDLHNLIGTQRKQQRLQFLKNYWMERVADVPGIQFYTSMNPEFGCAIGSFGIKGRKAVELSESIYRDWKIHTVGIEWEQVNGVRVTPHVYTSLQDLDKLVKAIKKLVV